MPPVVNLPLLYPSRVVRRGRLRADSIVLLDLLDRFHRFFRQVCAPSIARGCTNERENIPEPAEWSSLLRYRGERCSRDTAKSTPPMIGSSSSIVLSVVIECDPCLPWVIASGPEIPHRSSLPNTCLNVARGLNHALGVVMTSHLE